MASVFGGNQHLELLRETFPERVGEIIGTLVNKSKGVFLWVVLESQSVLQGLAAGDYIDELEERIKEMPADVEKLFTHIIRSIEPRFRFQGMKLLRIAYEHKIAYESDDKIQVLSFLVYAERGNGFSCASLLQQGTDIPQKPMCNTLEMRLRSRCCGLLELTEGYHSYSERMSGRHAPINSIVGSLHRTLFQYLKEFDFTAMCDFRRRALQF